MTIRHAEWCDVCAVNGSWAWAYISRPATLTCETPHGVQWVVDLPEWLLYVRCAAMGDRVAVIGQGHDTGRLVVVIDGRVLPRSDVMMFARSVIRASDDEWHLAVQTEPARWMEARLSRDGAVLVTIEQSMPQTSQGFLRWGADAPVRTDDVREYQHNGGVALLYPQIASDLVIGQHPTEPIVAGVYQGQRVRVAEMEAYEPYGVALAGGTYAICSRTPYGSELQIVRPPFVLEPPEPTPVPTPDPPTPTPDPEPAPTPVPPTPIPEPDPMPEYPYPDEQTWWPARIREMEALYAEAGEPINLGAFLWLTRTAYSARGMPQEAAWTQHRRELRAALGLPPNPC